MTVRKSDRAPYRTMSLLLGILFLATACTNRLVRDESKGAQAAMPLVALDQACLTPPPEYPDLHLTIAQQPVSRSGVWLAFPGWTIPIALAGSYEATLSIPTGNGFKYDVNSLKVTMESTRWRITYNSQGTLSGGEQAGSPVLYNFVIVPNPGSSPPGMVGGAPPSRSMIKLMVAGVKTPDGKPVPPFVLRVVDSSESMPSCPDTASPNS